MQSCQQWAQRPLCRIRSDVHVAIERLRIPKLRRNGIRLHKPPSPIIIPARQTPHVRRRLPDRVQVVEATSIGGHVQMGKVKGETEIGVVDGLDLLHQDGDQHTGVVVRELSGSGA